MPKQPTPKNPLRAYFRANEGRTIHKWSHYFEICHRHLRAYRGKPVTVIEFGVKQGGSLQMWAEYFGPDATLVGVDVDPRCASLGDERTTIEIGDQEDRDFLRSLVDKHGPFDVVIEDGGHKMGQQIATFEEIYPATAPDGVFLVEDAHTSFVAAYGGGYRRAGTFWEYAKGLTDQLNAWHSEDPALVVDDVTRSTKSVHFYPHVVVFERGVVDRPRHGKRGHDVFDPHPRRTAARAADRAADRGPGGDPDDDSAGPAGS